MCEQIPTKEYESVFLAKWQDTFYGGLTSAECLWITSCGTGMNLSFIFFLHDDKLKGTVSRDFLLLVFFLESVSPKPLIIP